MSDVTHRAQEALTPLAHSLQADGYELRVDSEDEQRLGVHIVATEDACEDCLAPPHVFEPVIQDLLNSNQIEHSGFALHYPSGEHPGEKQKHSHS